MTVKAPLTSGRDAFDLSIFLQSGAIMSVSEEKLLIGWGDVHKTSSNEIRPDQPVFYFTDFFLAASHPWLQYSHWREISKGELLHHFHPICTPSPSPSSSPSSSPSPSPSSSPSSSPCEWVIDPKEHFKKAFDDLFRLFQAGRLQKGVPYLFARSSNAMNEERLKNSLHRALTILNQRGGYLYGHWHLSSGVLGLTPELLFSHSEEHPSKVHTMALAGTCPLSEANEAFLKNEKERHEHQLVVHGIYASLKKLGTVKKGEMQLLKLSKLAHLMTPIEIDLFHSFDFDNLVKCLHPTPALGAFPLEEGREWLQGLQREIPRHFYGAPIGIKYSKSGLSKCYVAIRNVQWDERGMRIGAGCGVVQESLFEKEWQEIQLKISSIREQLAL